MIKIEKIGEDWSVQIMTKHPEQEFALICAGLLKEMSPEELHKIIDKVAVEFQDLIEDISTQQKKFGLRFMHLLELNNLTLDGLIKEMGIGKEDEIFLRAGKAPSLECLKAISQRLGVEMDYLMQAV